MTASKEESYLNGVYMKQEVTFGDTQSTIMDMTDIQEEDDSHLASLSDFKLDFMQNCQLGMFDFQNLCNFVISSLMFD